MDLFISSPVPSASASGVASESSGGGSSVNLPKKTRSACNRCHAQKLKCVKKGGRENSCERCFRLRTACRSGPRVARSSLKRPDPTAVGITLEDPLSMPASVSMLTRHSDTTIAGVGEMELLLPFGESTDVNGGCGQLAVHFSEEIYSN
jgi:hypothetical protein